jgi:hypothetical protein
MRSMGLACCTGSRSRSAMAFPRPGIRAPPPDVKRRVRPLLERNAGSRGAVDTDRQSSAQAGERRQRVVRFMALSKRSASHRPTAPLPHQVFLKRRVPPADRGENRAVWNVRWSGRC